MDLHHLLQQRDAILRQARLANLAYAHQRLGEFSARLARAGISGPLRLEAAAPEEGRPDATLEAACSPAVVAEHFLEGELTEFAELLAFMRGAGDGEAQELAAAELESALLPALARLLAREGVTGLEPSAGPGREVPRA